MRGWKVLLGVGAFVVSAACTLAVPDAQVTPTVAPSRTPTEERPTEIAFASITPFLSPTPQPTDPPTDQPTPTRTERPSLTPLPTIGPTSTPTATQTDTPSPTLTNTPQPSITPTRTPTPTNTATFTAPPPTNTFTPRPPTLTFTPDASSTWTPVPLPSPTRTLTGAELAALTPSEPAIAPVGVRETEPPPTLDATPTFITVEAPSTPQIIGSVLTEAPPDDPQSPDGVPDVPTATQPPPTVAINPQDIPPTVDLDSLLSPPLPGGDPNTLAFALSTDGGAGIQRAAFDTGNINGVVLFARNPADPNEYAMVNNAGQIYLGNIGGSAGIGGDPFTRFTYEVRSREENDAAIGEIRWSQDGKLAFVIDAGKQDKDGVWVREPGGGLRQILRDCPRQGHPGCNTVRGQRNANQWRSDEVTWRPVIDANQNGIVDPAESSDTLLIELEIPDEGRRGFVLENIATANREVLPQVYRYDSATWSVDGNRVLASGVGPDGQPVMGWLNRGGGEVQVFYNGAAQNLWPREAVQQPDGEIFALASQGNPNGPVRLIDANGGARSEQIGNTPPSRVQWSPDRSAVLVQTQDGASYIVRADSGTIIDISNEVREVRAVDWIEGQLPVAADAIINQLPSGVIADSRYNAGQQLRVLSQDGLFLRSAPGTAAEVVGSVLQGDFVAVLAGPVEISNVIWWQVQTAAGERGWVAGNIGGVDMIGS